MMPYEKEALLKKVLIEMGKQWDDTPGPILIEGVTAEEYFKNHAIFSEEKCVQQVLFNETELNMNFVQEWECESASSLLAA